MGNLKKFFFESAVSSSSVVKWNEAIPRVETPGSNPIHGYDFFSNGHSVLNLR